jgi:hypothetical protein
MRFPPADLNTPVSNEPAPPPCSIPTGATPTHRLHAPARSPGCAQASQDRHRRCTVSNAFSSSTRPLASSVQNPQPVSRHPSLTGIAAEAEGLQLAEVVRPALVPGHDVVHLQGPLMRVCQATACPAAFAAALGPGEHPDFDRAADRRAVAAPVPEAAGFCVSKQHTSSPRCIRKASRRWRHSCSSSSRSGSATLAFGQVTALLSSTAAQKPSATPPTRP